MGFHHVGQAGVELLAYADIFNVKRELASALNSQVAPSSVIYVAYLVLLEYFVLFFKKQCFLQVFL